MHCVEEDIRVQCTRGYSLIDFSLLLEHVITGRYIKTAVIRAVILVNWVVFQPFLP